MTAKTELNKIIAPYLIHDGCLPEGSDEINHASREIIKEYALNFSRPCLVNVNYKDEKDILIDARTVVWYNFCACAIIPKYDQELYNMIKDRINTPYTGTAADYPLVNAIFDRIEELGGTTLHFT